MSLPRQIERVKSLVGSLFAKELEKEEFGYYAIIPLPSLNNAISNLVDRVLSLFGTRYELVRTYEPNVILLPPSKWDAGNVLSREFRCYYASTRYINRRQRLQRRRNDK
jgi:hypothetical protein